MENKSRKPSSAREGQIALSVDSTTPKPVFLYLKAYPLSDRQLKKIAGAGYIAVPVNSFESVKIIEPAMLFQNDPISKAALRAIVSSQFRSVREHFGGGVAKALLEGQ